MTKEEFALHWATGTGFSIEELKMLNIYPIPCNCEEEGCKGWQMWTQDYVRPKELSKKD